jgi:hypothetical protein
MKRRGRVTKVGDVKITTMRLDGRWWEVEVVKPKPNGWMSITVDHFQDREAAMALHGYHRYYFRRLRRQLNGPRSMAVRMHKSKRG